MNFPEDLKYTKDHEWVRMAGNTATIGITEFAQGELGDIVYVDINTVGQAVAQHHVFGTVDAVKTASDLYMPMSGKIITFNSLLVTQPHQVNQDPYGQGWMVQVDVSNPTELAHLLTSTQYKELVGK